MSKIDLPFENTNEFYGNDEDTVKYKLRHFGKFKIVVILACVFALISLIFIVLFAVEKSKIKSESSTSTFCNTRNCLVTSYDMLQQLNQSVDPCDNFYEYACGGWIKNNALKKGETVKNGFSMLQKKNNLILKQAIESSEKNYPKNEAVLKTAKFYKSCIDELSVEKLGMAPMKQMISDFGGWHINGSLPTRPLLSRIAQMNRELVSPPLFKVNVYINPTDSSKHILMFSRATIGLSKGYYVTDTPDNLKVRKAYQQYMKDVAKLLGGSNASDAQMMEVYEFESKLAAAEHESFRSYSSVEEHLQATVAAAGGSFNYLTLTPTLQQFGNMSDVPLDIITNFLSEVFQDQKYTFTKDDIVFAWPTSYFVRLFSLFAIQTKTNPKVLDNYAMWTAINQLVLASPSEFIEAKRRFGQAVSGNFTTERWESCLSNMQSAFEMPLGLLFVDKAFKDESRKMITDMTSYIRQAFIDNIDKNDWMDTYTKEKAKEKAKAIAEDVGYPDYIKDPVKLANELKGLEIGKGLFSNVRKMMKWAVANNLASLKKPVDKDKWFMGPSVVNGYYAPVQNRIVFLAAILQPPFYDPIHPMYLTFGGIGMVIGHEITHGFDNQGRVFDKDGNIKQWWTSSSSANFLKRSQCLIDQYSNFEMFGTKIKGNQTINENIADNGGIKIAFQGYKAWSKKHGVEGALPGLGMTMDQLFFIGFAQPWCSIYTKKPALRQINVDNHSNAKYRVIGTLQNFPQFSESFKCKSGTYMNPAKKCGVW